MALTDGEFGYHDLERAALGFVLEAETWPVFLEWARGPAGISPAIAAWVTDSPDVEEARRLWCLHSPDPIVRSLA